MKAGRPKGLKITTCTCGWRVTGRGKTVVCKCGKRVALTRPRPRPSHVFTGKVP